MADMPNAEKAPQRTPSPDATINEKPKDEGGLRDESQPRVEFTTLTVDTPAVLLPQMLHAPAAVHVVPQQADSVVGTNDLIDVSSSSNSLDQGSSRTNSDNGKGIAHYALDRAETPSDRIATREQLEDLSARYPLPPGPSNTRWSQIRYLWLTFYRRLMILVLAVNVSVIAAMIARTQHRPGSFTYANAATATGANLLAAILMRQEHVINTLFHVVLAQPSWTPIQMRRNVAKVAYNNGGIHSSCGISALLWYIFYTVLLVTQFRGTDGQRAGILATTAVTLALFVLVVGSSHPAVRRKFHNAWELAHRFSGWSAIAAVWTQTIIIAVAVSHSTHRTVGHTLVRTPTFWFLVVITCCLIYPWLWLRRLPVDAKQLSTHATQLHFTNRNVPACVTTRLSHTPLRENHSFATIAARRDVSVEKGYTVLVSNGGDWSKKLILEPPTHIWQRGAPTTGVMRLSSLFRPIVIVTTGSGIGPCASFLNVHVTHPVRILWSARSPEETYGRPLMENVLQADPNVIIIDTKKTGPPNMPALAFALVREIGAEGVMCLSNPRLTREVVYAMESRGIPAFGAIFDS